jgi:hypothetical protein
VIEVNPFLSKNFAIIEFTHNFASLPFLHLDAEKFAIDQDTGFFIKKCNKNILYFPDPKKCMDSYSISTIDDILNFLQYCRTNDKLYCSLKFRELVDNQKLSAEQYFKLLDELFIAYWYMDKKNVCMELVTQISKKLTHFPGFQQYLYTNATHLVNNFDYINLLLPNNRIVIYKDNLSTEIIQEYRDRYSEHHLIFMTNTINTTQSFLTQNPVIRPEKFPINFSYIQKIMVDTKKKIGFTAGHLSERGTSTALYDYAFYNQKLLGNHSIIFYEKNHPENFPEYIALFNSQFKCYEYEKFTEIDEIIKIEHIDAMYIIKYGKRDNMMVKNCINLIHSVYVNEPHGEKYALVSRWLSEKYGNKSYVPHMINLPDHQENLRLILNIPEDAIVFGGYGGKDAFNIKFVHQTINQIVMENNNIYFLFMNFAVNTEPSERIIYLPPTIDRYQKVKFINTCDAMIHAQSLGETFGLAIGEFSSCGKPIITYSDKTAVDLNHPFNNKEHTRILGNNGIYYTNQSDLYGILTTYKKHTGINCYTEYTPEKVMEKFKTVFLEDN